MLRVFNRNLADKSVEEFLAESFDSDSFSEGSPSSPLPKKVSKMQTSSSQSQNLNGKKSKKAEAKSLTQKKVKDKSKSQKLTKAKGDKKIPESGALSMKKSLQKLKDTDPEFYEFLKAEDKSLLEFDDEAFEEDVDQADDLDIDEDHVQYSRGIKERKDAKAFEKAILDMSSGESEGSDEDDAQEDDDKGRRHKLPSKLEVASDDEEFEDSNDEGKGKKRGSGVLVTMAMIKTWTSQLQKNASVEVMREAIAALAAAIQQASSGGETGNLEVDTKYRVENSTVFNAVIRMCLTEMAPAFQTLLGLSSLSDAQQRINHKSKKWKSLRGTAKNYCTLLLQLTGELSEAGMINVVLKHIHKLVVCYAGFPKLSKAFMKKMISIWSSGEETTRVLAFLCIIKLVRMQQENLLEPCLKKMYMAYVSNCKFITPVALPLVNFMQHSLVEILLVDEVLAYQHAFVYIRQLAIHLRNAITTKKKETCQAVYNWQYVLSLGLWTRMLSTAHPSPTLQPLVYPLTQVIIGTIRLLPTARYYPLRFHCLRYLTKLSGSTNTFIPVLPFLLEVLEQTDFNKRAKSTSFKNFNMACILKFSKTQLQEKAFKDALIDQLFELMLDNLHVHAHSVAFPELVVPLVVQLRDFLKKCKVTTYCKQLKQILDKVEETAKFITAKRRTTTFNLTDTKAVDLWEARSKEEGTPLAKYYSSWRKLRDRELQHEIAQKEQISGAAEELPEIIRRRTPAKPTEDEKREFGALFADDVEEDSEDDNIRFMLKEERESYGKKKTVNGAGTDSEEEYSDFDSDELEQLAKSASENDDSDDEEEEEKITPPQKPTKRVKSSQGASQEVKRKRAKHEKNKTSNLDDIVEDFKMSDLESD
ncbi:hypothetical protein C0Q70_04067 [Pomacea canaliculata]|uniref:Uncharacterized protein n=1 Tax=Pomacea canaliculata TaxID=400727 RepID=A0A2T7PUG6_POMCA|nr:hypothetical protein C0Q70_04067 [Pomacea canaliculata]